MAVRGSVRFLHSYSILCCNILVGCIVMRFVAGHRGSLRFVAVHCGCVLCCFGCGSFRFVDGVEVRFGSVRFVADAVRGGSVRFCSWLMRFIAVRFHNRFGSVRFVSGCGSYRFVSCGSLFVGGSVRFTPVRFDSCGSVRFCGHPAIANLVQSKFTLCCLHHVRAFTS